MYDRPLESIKRGRMPSRSELNRMAEKVDQVSQISINGAGMTTQNDQLNVDMPTANRYNAKITGGSQPYSWITIVADESDDGTTWRETGEITAEVNDRIALWERSGNTNVPADTEGVVAELDPRSGLWYFDFPDPDEMFPGRLTRKLISSGGTGQIVTYAFTKDKFLADDSPSTPDSPSGSGGVQEGIVQHGAAEYGRFSDIKFLRTQTSNGTSTVDVFKVTLTGTTSGVFPIKEDGGADILIDYAASDAAINALLTLFTVASVTSGTVYPIKVYTFTANSPHSPPHSIGPGFGSAYTTRPAAPCYPAYFMSSLTPMDVPVNVMLRRAWGHPAKIQQNTTQQADGVSISQIIKLTITNAIEGLFAVVDNSTSTSADIAWVRNASALNTDIETDLLAALSTIGNPATVTFFGGTATITFSGFGVHNVKFYDPGVAAHGLPSLVGSTAYIAFLSNGNLATAPIAGVDPKYVGGWTDLLSWSISITPTSGVGPFVLLVQGATSGTYQITDGIGSPSVQNWDSPPTLTGITAIVIAPGRYALFGDGITAHSFTVADIDLDGANPDQILVISYDGTTSSVSLEPYTP